MSIRSSFLFSLFACLMALAGASGCAKDSKSPYEFVVDHAP
jgi:hypothetical protein